MSEDRTRRLVPPETFFGAGIDSCTVRARQAEAYLVGKTLTADTAREAAELAVSQCVPLPRNGYKVAVLRALVARALAGAAETVGAS